MPAVPEPLSLFQHHLHRVIIIFGITEMVSTLHSDERCPLFYPVSRVLLRTGDLALQTSSLPQSNPVREIDADKDSATMRVRWKYGIQNPRCGRIITGLVPKGV